VTYARKPDRSAFIGHAVLDFKVAELHSDAHAETVDGEHAALADGKFARTRNLR
jgi:hypothetical protein